jgi:hypothetical protein
MATSPYTYNALQNAYKTTGGYQATANHFQSMIDKGNRSGAIIYARNKYAQLARQSHLNEIAFGKKWLAAGRPGALEALQARYPTQDALAASGKLTAFDPQGGVEQLGAKRNLDQSLINLTNQENLLNQQYTTSKSDYQAKVPQLARQLLSNYAGRGMAFSTGYGEAVGQQNADIARGLSNLDLQRQQQMADITSQRGIANTNYKNDLATSMVGTVNRLSARAGTLGFGPKGRDIYNDPTLLAALAKKLLGG